MIGRRPESFGLVMDRIMRRVRRMPYRTQPERQARANALMEAMVEWKQRHEDSRRRASHGAG